MKIAFLFLCISDIHFPKSWEQFFKHNEGKYSIYCHPKYPRHVKTPWLKTCIIENLVETGWGFITRAYEMLLREACKDPQNIKFITISESCIPVKPFSHVYNRIFQYNLKTSFIKQMRVSKYDFNERIKTQSNYHKIKHFTKHYARFCLSQYHVKKLLNHPQLEFFHKMHVGDEFFLTCLLPWDYVIDFDITFDDWDSVSKIVIDYNKRIKRLYDEQEKNLNINNKKQIKQLQAERDNIRKNPKSFYKISNSTLIQMENTKCFFFRKFPMDSEIYRYIDDPKSKFSIQVRRIQKLDHMFPSNAFIITCKGKPPHSMKITYKDIPHKLNYRYKLIPNKIQMDKQFKYYTLRLLQRQSPQETHLLKKHIDIYLDSVYQSFNINPMFKEILMVSDKPITKKCMYFKAIPTHMIIQDEHFYKKIAKVKKYDLINWGSHLIDKKYIKKGKTPTDRKILWAQSTWKYQLCGLMTCFRCLKAGGSFLLIVGSFRRQSCIDMILYISQFFKHYHIMKPIKFYDNVGILYVWFDDFTPLNQDIKSIRTNLRLLSEIKPKAVARITQINMEVKLVEFIKQISRVLVLKNDDIINLYRLYEQDKQSYIRIAGENISTGEIYNTWLDKQIKQWNEHNTIIS
uniref:Core-2/I-branching enzyme n=1 Tax=Megaviridae environmental sample TaxID=1737588 RepID=A0A5J6VI89_9VIRU|nr:MAG: core-2/I-branching enzyme [Megaviridae environmental sample]